MVRAALEIKLIEDKPKRHTTFTKRRQGLIKKTRGFADKFDAEAAVIIFSKAGNGFAFGHPSVDSLVSRYLDESQTPPEEQATSGGGAEEERTSALTEEEAGKRIGQALESGRWDSAVEGLGIREIQELYKDIVKIKRVVAARAEEMAARFGDGSTAEGRGLVEILGESAKS